MVLDRLLHIADLHFWHVEWNPLLLANKRLLGNLNVLLRRRREFDMTVAQTYTDEVVDQDISNVLLTGDFTSTATDREFTMAAQFIKGLSERGLDIVLTPGNHDVYTFESVRKNRFMHHLATFVPENGYPASQTLPGGTSLLLLSTVCPNILSSKGVFREKDAPKLELLLDSATDPLLVAGHFPILTDTDTYHLTPSRRLRNAERLRGILAQSGKQILYIAGHVHRFSLVRDPQHENLIHLSTGAFFRRSADGITGEFSEVHIGEHTEIHRHVRRGGQWQRTAIVPR